MENVFPRQLSYLFESGLAEEQGDAIQLTSRGIFHVNGISKLFYSPSRKDSLQVLGMKTNGMLILEKDY